MIEKIVFGGGSFWLLQNKFDKLEGVISTLVGYSGGDSIFPKFNDVAQGGTGHIEVIEILYDTSIISFQKVCELFFSSHNFSEEESADFSHYKSIIFYQNLEQQELLKKFIGKLEGLGDIVTELKPPTTFYVAEENHQKYIQKKFG